MISKTESGGVSKEIPGSGSGSGTRWALAVDCSHLKSFSALSTTIVEGAERRRCFLINRHSSSDRCGAEFFIDPGAV